MRSVLVTDGGDGQSRSAVAAVRALRTAGYRPVVTTSGPNNLAAASRDAAATVAVPPVDDADYPVAVADAAALADAVAVLPGSDASIVALGLPAQVLVDKTALGRLAASAGFTPPDERRFESFDELRASPDLPFPIVVKAERKVRGAAFEAQRADRVADLDRLRVPVGVPLVAQRLVPGGLRAVCGVMWRGEFAAVVHQRCERLWPPGCGVASAAVVVSRDETTESKLLALLAHHDGIFQAQLIGDHLLDLNPRVYGSLPLAVAAGVNLPAIWCGLLEHGDAARHRTLSASVGARYRWLEGDVRSVASSFRAGEIGLVAALGALAPRRHTAHSIESLRDPGPMLGRARAVLGRRGG